MTPQSFDPTEPAGEYDLDMKDSFSRGMLISLLRIVLVRTPLLQKRSSCSGVLFCCCSLTLCVANRYSTVSFVLSRVARFYHLMLHVGSVASHKSAHILFLAAFSLPCFEGLCFVINETCTEDALESLHCVVTVMYIGKALTCGQFALLGRDPAF